MAEVQVLPYNTQEDTDYAYALALAASLGEDMDENSLAHLLQLQEYEDCINQPSEKAKSDFPETDEAKIAMVCDAMADYEGWESVDREQVKIKTNSGAGGSETYLITAPETCIPNRVGLHSRQKDSHKLPRLIAALKAFENRDLGPKLLAMGSNYWIDQWEGVGDFSGSSAEMWNKCGRLLARVHTIPIDWFDELKAKYIDQEPVAAVFPEGTFAWVHLQRESWQSDLPSMSDDSKYEYATAVTTDHSIAARIVTAHGDFHPGNIIDLGEEQNYAGVYRFRCIDFEFSCVTHAIHDLSYGICCAGEADKKKAFLSGYLEDVTGQEPSDEEIRSLQLEAELYKLTLWHSGGMLCPWEQGDETEETIMELVAAVKNFVEYVRKNEDAQNELLEKGLEDYKSCKGHPLHTYCKEKMAKKMEGLVQEAEDAALVFEEKLNEPKEEEKEPSDLLEKAVWTQPEGAQHPMKIGSSSELGLIDQSFTAMCWVKNERAVTGEAWYKDRNPIFMGDVDPEGNGLDWEDYKSKIFHLELRHENRYYFGFGWDDTSSKRMCRLDKWDHVAFVYDKSGEGKSIIVNGECTDKRWGKEVKPYLGDDTIWLGSKGHHNIEDWGGKIEKAMIFNEALSPEQIFEIAASTRPEENEESEA